MIPKEIRDKFNFIEGSKLIVVASGETVVLQRIETVLGTAKAKDLVEKIGRLTGRMGLASV